MDFSKYFSKYFYKVIFDTKERVRDFQAKRNDVGRGLEIEIAENGAIENLGNASMLFVAKKPDGTKVLYSAGKKDNAFTIEFSRQLFTVAGRVQCELKLLGEKGEVLGSKNFGIVVAQDLQMDLNSNNDFQVIKKCLDQLGTIPEKVEQLTNAVQSAENFTARTIEIENAETARARAENARNQKETERQASETNRTQAESQRQAGETARARAETARAEAERLRVQKLQEITTQAEQIRTAETQRVEAERARVQTEAQRTEAENQRARAERERASNHTTQSQALTEAQRAYTTNKQEIDTLLPTMQGLKTQTEEVLSSLRNISVGNVASEIAELRQRIEAQASTVNEQVLNQKIAELTQGLPEEVNTVKKIGNHLHHLRGNFSQRMDGAESKIRNLETGISGKVNVSDFNAYKEEAETTFVAGSALTSAISQAKTEIARDYVAKSTYTSDLQNIRSQLAQPQGVNETEVNRLIAAQVATLPTTESVQQLITSGTSEFVRKEEGKGLSTNDYTTEEKNKLAGISLPEITRLRPVDSLDSTDALRPLSSRQGKILKDMIEALKENGDSPALLEAGEVRAVQEGNNSEALDRLFAKTTKMGATFEKGLRLSNTGLASVETFDLLLENASLRSLFLESEAGIRAIVNSRVAIQKLFTFLNKSSNNYPVLINNVRLMQAISNSDIALQAMCDMADIINVNLTNQNGFWLNILSAKKAVVKFFKHQKMAYKIAYHLDFWSSEKSTLVEQIYRLFSGWQREERKVPVNMTASSPIFTHVVRPSVVFSEFVSTGTSPSRATWYYPTRESTNSYPERIVNLIPNAFDSKTLKKILYKGCYASVPQSGFGTNENGYLITYTVYLDEEE